MRIPPIRCSLRTCSWIIPRISVGVVDTVPLNQHLYGAFVYFEAVFLALGIALRIRRMRIQRIDAERRLNRSLAGELEATQRAVRLAEEREWALGDLAEKGRLILAAGHDTRQMISSLRHYALGLQRSAGPERAAAAGAALQQIASNLGLQVVVLDTGDQLTESFLKEASAMGLHVVCMTRPEEAVEVASRERVLVLVDEHFGGSLAGLKLAREIQRKAPGSSVALMTFDRSIEARMRAVDACPVTVYKPLSLDLLRAVAVRQRTDNGSRRG
ncbi:MAG: hypothetical protein U5Q16_10640 [Gammaproteobacteria bacterium]|nr:hypothetical protein [Gammaproteobacteria bacterium]